MHQCTNIRFHSISNGACTCWAAIQKAHLNLLLKHWKHSQLSALPRVLWTTYSLCFSRLFKRNYTWNKESILKTLPWNPVQQPHKATWFRRNRVACYEMQAKLAGQCVCCQLCLKKIKTNENSGFPAETSEPDVVNQFCGLHKYMHCCSTLNIVLQAWMRQYGTKNIFEIQHV